MESWGDSSSKSMPANPCYARLMKEWLEKNTNSKEAWAEIDEEHTKISDLNNERILKDQ